MTTDEATERQRQYSKNRRLAKKEPPIYKMADGNPLANSAFRAEIGTVSINGVRQGGLVISNGSAVEKGTVLAEYGGRVVYRSDLTLTEEEYTNKIDADPLPDQEEVKKLSLSRIVRLTYAHAVKNQNPTILVEHYDDLGVDDEQFSESNMLGRYANSFQGRQNLKQNADLVHRFYKKKEYPMGKTPEQVLKSGKGDENVGYNYVRVFIVAKSTIMPGEEILVNYGKGFKF